MTIFAADADTSSFLRIRKDENGHPAALQVATKSYVSRGEHGPHLRIDLVGAVHVAEADYYADLNARFRDYDVVLYELIAASDADIPKSGERSNSMISSTQLAITRALGLSFQLDEIDYGAENFVHADMSPAEMSQSMDERGESLYTYFWKLFYVSVDEYAKDPLGLRNVDLISALLAPDGENALKIELAKQLLETKSITAVFEGEQGSTIISARNIHALQELRHQIDAGRQHIAIFYGAAHMQDMERRLLQTSALGIDRTIWTDAWQLKANPRSH